MPWFSWKCFSFGKGRNGKPAEPAPPDIPDIPPAARQLLADEAVAARLLEILRDSLRLTETTTCPKTFFSRYEDALRTASRIAETSCMADHQTYAQAVLSDLTAHREEKIRVFIDRCAQQGKLYAVKDELLSDRYEIPIEMKAYAERLIRELEAQPADLPENGVYLYCSISFVPGEKTYYYKTRDESLQCGDEVIVPVGNQGCKGVGTIQKIQRFAAGETPYPPGLTKDILGKCPY